MLIHPQIDPVAIAIGPLAVRWYGLMYLVGFGMAFLLARSRIKQGGSGNISFAVFDDLFFFCVLGVVLGVISARRPYSLLDNLNSFLALIGYSIPVFWLGQLLLMFLSLKLNLFPAQGMVSLRRMPTGLSYYLDVGHHLVLPVLALGLRYLAVNSRYARASMLEVMRSDHVTVARAKGLSERAVTIRHIFRNAMLPIVTIIALDIPNLLGGAVITEQIFQWPGMGMMTIRATNLRDYPMLMGILLVSAIMILASNLIGDVLYAVVDPRIRYD